MRRSLTLFATLFLLWAISAQINHYLSGLHVSLFLGGLCVVFAALRLNRNEGLLTSFATGLLFDATSPLWFGCHALLFATAHIVVFRFRSRVPRDETLIPIVIGLLANLGIHLGVSFVALHDLPPGVNPWPRLLADLLFSQIALVLVAPWFLRLQERSLEIVGADLRLDQPGV
ncbi:MAG: rod shape-determining protein MreD [Opitutaceae bacterium]|nr:rod shape-determining protein MreD [Opitutaceae bacterium]